MNSKSRTMSNNKNIGGNIMSSKKTVQRRLSLLTGSSLMAAMLSAGAFTGVALAPTVALADNECVPIGVDPSANGSTDDAFVCSDPIGTYTTGVTYSSDGDLSVESTVDNNEFGGNGIQLTGNGGDSVNFLADGVEIEGRDLVGALLDITTDTGDITIEAEAVDADAHGASGVTHAIRAISTGGGDIDITTTGAVQAANSAGAGAIAIEATSAGGDISITTGNQVNGRSHGMVLETSGAGGIDLNLGGTVSTNFGVAGIDAIAGTGGFSLTTTGGIETAIIVESTGGAEVNILAGDTTANVDFSGVTGGGVIFNAVGVSASSGRWRPFGDSVFSSGADTLTMSGVAVSNMGGGRTIDFGDGADTFNLGITFTMVAGSTTLLFGAGDDRLNMTGRLFAENGAVLDFGSGADTFDMTGDLSIEGVTTISALETLNLSGDVYLGSLTEGESDDLTDDVLRMTNGTFNGMGGVVAMDTFIGDRTQAGCATLTGAGDCLDLRGASTAGETPILITNLSPPSVVGRYNPTGVTLVDVGGAGSSAAGHIVIDPASAGYVDHPVYGDSINMPGLFVYSLRYDPETQRHSLVGLPEPALFEYNILSSAAQSIWHMTTETVTDRQADLRSAPDTGAVWMRTTGEYTKRDASSGFTSFSDDFVFDNSYKLYAGTIIGGMDLIQGRSGGLDYVTGVQIGYVGSSLEIDGAQSSAHLTGATGGIYGSIWNDHVFLDATFNMNGLALEYESPALGSKTITYTTAFGGRLEGGMRYTLSDVLFAEPIVSLAFVRTGFEELSLFGGEIRPGDAQSRRAALGLRLGGDVDGQAVNWSYFITGRAWNEFDGESDGVINNVGPELMFTDEFSGSFGQVEAGLSLYNDANTLSGFASTGLKWMDGYNAIDLSLGLRMAW